MDFLNSAEQPFAKACRTSVLLSRGAYGERHTQTSGGKLRTKHTRAHSLSLRVLFSVRSVDGFQCDATALPIHC